MIPLTAFSSSNSENTKRLEHPLSHVQDRGPINHNFDPDESCNLNAYQLKCIPGFEQDCPDGYHNGEDNVCSPIGCPEGYHGEDDDEIGQCYQDSEGCSNDEYYVLRERGDGEGVTCSTLYNLCADSSDNRDHPRCKEYIHEEILEDTRGLQTDFVFVNGTCAEGFDITKDGQMCVRGENEDCAETNQTTYRPLCDGSRDRDGLIFCDIYATFTGSRIAYGGCYDRNDNPVEYCSHFATEEGRNDDGWTCDNLL